MNLRAAGPPALANEGSRPARRGGAQRRFGEIL